MGAQVGKRIVHYSRSERFQRSRHKLRRVPEQRELIYSGLDWSGSPGEVHGDVVVFAVVHFSDAALSTLSSALQDAREALGIPPDYVFKNNGTGPRTREGFFHALGPLDFSANVHVLDKRRWAETQHGKLSGPNCIRDGIVSLVMACPEDVVARQVLYLDIEPSQHKEITRLKTEIRQALRGARPRRVGFADVRGCEDHRNQGAIIQVADMLAGQVNDHGGIAGPHLPALGRKITLV